MQTRFRVIRRGSRDDIYYCVDTATGKRSSLERITRDEAQQIILAKNQAIRQPALNLSFAKAYLAGSDSGVATRTWQAVLDTLVSTKTRPNQLR